jgi:hypothetical protein
MYQSCAPHVPASLHYCFPFAKALASLSTETALPSSIQIGDSYALLVSSVLFVHAHLCYIVQHGLTRVS